MLRRTLLQEHDGSPNGLLANDRVWFDSVWKLHRVPIMRLALKMLRDHEAAQDAVQETSLRAFQNLHLYDRSKPIRPWLFRICMNCCIDAIRAQQMARLKRNVESPGEYDSPNSIVDSLHHGMLQTQIIEATYRLPPKYRQIIWMRHFQNKDISEIATELGAPAGTIKALLHQGRLLLRHDLSGAVPY